MHIMLPQIIVICLIIWLLNTLNNVITKRVYDGPDKHFYEPYARRIVPGMHQQLMSFQNTAYVYGGFGFDIPCEKYMWVVFDNYRYDDRQINCTVIGRGIYKFENLHPCTMNLIYMMAKHDAVKLWNAFRVPLYVKTACDQPLEPVKSHLTVSAGPGWLVVRFPVPYLFMYMAAFRIAYRKPGDNKWVKTRMSEYITWGRIVPRVKPSIPCPPWRQYSMFCLMVTDHIRVVDSPYLTYEAMIQGVGLLDAEEYDFRIVNYKFTFRALNCDVFAEGKCAPAFGPMAVDPIPATMSDLDYFEKVRGAPWTVRPINKSELESMQAGREAKKPMSDRVISMIVLGSCLIVIVLVLLFLGLFCCAKRRAKQRTLANWYFISSDTWPVNYTLRLPPGLPRSDKGLAGRGTQEEVSMNVISKRPMLSLATKHYTRTDHDKQPEN